jgi:Sugar phosphate isomerases/epimerases
MRLGGTVLCNEPAKWEQQLIASGFRAITAPFNCNSPRDEIHRYCDIAAGHDVLIAELGVWKNPFDAINGEANLEYAKRQLALADELAVPCCVNIVGTFSSVGWDAADKSNFTDDTYGRIVEMIREIIDDVNPRTACYCIEPMPWMIPDSPDAYLKLIRDVAREHFAAHMDFVNMINCPRRFLDAEGFVGECFAKLAPYIKSTHIKDSRMDLKHLTTILEECPPGKGMLDFVSILRIIDKYLSKDAPVLLEHMSTFEEYSNAFRYVAQAAEAAGIGI